MFETGGMNRRALLQRALVLAGATAAIGACDAIGFADSDSPFRHSAEDMALITALANVIVPTGDTVGAIDAGVPASFEGLMANWASPETREAMASVLETLGALDPDGADFAGLSEARQAELLTAFDTEALAPAEGGGGSPFGPPPASNPDYQRFKQLVVVLFYLSEPALTQEIAYTHIPGRWDPSVPVTPETRPQGGPGMF
ncbi:gluconate 2-dehydrogenase subunit 3 family protein [Aurantiacibacter gilvus]|uniref:Gluconate 2-dehydrogenase subunit 3 family protein n=1 Tax=Aurantiacibacter gilvus TaxID=3139141 RepID=A0ABU9IH87_9SPHN